MRVWRGLVVGAYGSGHLRVFSVDHRRREVALTIEVAAHAKWITALDIAPESGLILSVSEDSFAKVWQLSGSPDNLVSMILLVMSVRYCVDYAV